MMLHRVGSNRGIEQDYPAIVKNLSYKSNLYFAGGIRNIEDVYALQHEGFKGVLMATALHNGAISRQDIEDLYGD